MTPTLYKRIKLRLAQKTVDVYLCRGQKEVDELLTSEIIEERRELETQELDSFCAVLDKKIVAERTVQFDQHELGKVELLSEEVEGNKLGAILTYFAIKELYKECELVVGYAASYGGVKLSLFLGARMEFNIRGRFHSVFKAEHTPTGSSTYWEDKETNTLYFKSDKDTCQVVKVMRVEENRRGYTYDCVSEEDIPPELEPQTGFLERVNELNLFKEF